MSAQDLKDDPWRLDICWYEPHGDDKKRLNTCCSELIGSLYKLTFVLLELEETAEKPDLEAAYDYTDYHIENYLTRLFAMRERLLSAMHLLTGLDACDLKQKDKRPLKAPRFAAVAPKATEIVVELLDLIDDDIQTRNMDTHNAFFHIFLYSGHDNWVEPRNVLMEVEGQADGEARLRTVLRRFIEERCKRIKLIAEKIKAFVKAALDCR